MEIRIEDISLQEKFKSSLDDAVNQFQRQYEKFRISGAEIDFSTKVTTQTGVIGYRVIHPDC